MGLSYPVIDVVGIRVICKVLIIRQVIGTDILLITSVPLPCINISAVKVLGLALHERHAQDKKVARVESHYCYEQD